METMLSVKEAAVLKGVHRVDVREWIRAGRLPAEKIKNQWVIKKSDLDCLIKDGGRWVSWKTNQADKAHVSLTEFEKHLRSTGAAENTVKSYCRIVRRFIRHTNAEPLDRISPERARSFFDGIKGNWKEHSIDAVTQYLNFATAKMPVVITPEPVPEPIRDKKEIALREQWSLERLAQEKNRDEQLIARLARKVIDHFVYFQSRLKGEPENLNDVARFGAECKDLIQSNLLLFAKLSAEGHNVHSAIDERVIR